MKKFAFFAVATSAIVAFSSHLTLANQNEYHLMAFKNCKVVADKKLNQEQVDAYLALQASEKQMRHVSEPVENLQSQINEYTSKIEDLTRRAVIEDDSSLHIDKALLREQESVSKALEALLKDHEGEFAALEDEAAAIEQRAHQFENVISPLLDDVEHDFVRVTGPDNASSAHECYSDA